MHRLQYQVVDAVEVSVYAKPQDAGEAAARYAAEALKRAVSSRGKARVSGGFARSPAAARLPRSTRS